MLSDLTLIDLALKDEADNLASSLGISIPKDIHIIMWSLPLLKELAHRVQELERKVKKNET